MSPEAVAVFDRATAHELHAVIADASPLYQRIRANCCDEGMWPAEIDRHAAAITLVVQAARAA